MRVGRGATIGSHRPVARDTVTRADGAIGSTEAGQSWVQLSAAAATVVSDKIAPSTTSDTIYAYAAPGHRMHAADITYQGNDGLVFRGIDVNNFLFAQVASTSGGQVNLWKKSGGTFTLLTSVAHALTVGNTYRLSVRSTGTTVVIALDGVDLPTQTLTSADDTAFQGAMAGFRANGSTASRYDNFATLSPSAAQLVVDTVTRVNGAVGAAESGQAWVQGSGFGATVVSNKIAPSSINDTVYWVAPGGRPRIHAADVTYQGNDGLVFRGSDINNFLLAQLGSTSGGQVNLFKKSAGTFTLLASVANALTAGTTYRLSVSFSTDRDVVISVDGTVKLTYTLSSGDDSSFNGTKVGFRANGSTASRYDNFVTLGIAR